MEYIKTEEVIKQLENMIKPLINKWKGKEIKVNLAYRNKERKYEEGTIIFDHIQFYKKDLDLIIVSKSNLDWEVGWFFDEIITKEFVKDFEPFNWSIKENSLITINIGY